MSIFSLRSNYCQSFLEHREFASSSCHWTHPLASRIEHFSRSTQDSLLHLGLQIGALAENLLKISLAWLSLDLPDLKLHSWQLLTRPLSLLMTAGSLIIAPMALFTPQSISSVHRWLLQMSLATRALPYLSDVKTASIRWNKSSVSTTPLEKALSARAWLRLQSIFDQSKQWIELGDQINHWLSGQRLQTVQPMLHALAQLSPLEREKLVLQATQDIYTAHSLGLAT